jgi:hypothetical protein
VNVLPEDDAERGAILLADCLLDYFPNACAAVAKHSAKSNAKHNPGQPPHWARDKSTDHRNKIMRHLVDAGGVDRNGDKHSVALAWRALANLEDELIAEGATPGRNTRGAPKEHRRVATPAELAAYRDNGRRYPTDRKGVVFSTGDTVRIVDPSHDDVLCGFGKGSSAKVASRNHVNQMVLLQAGFDTRWFHGRQLEVIS